MKTILYSDDINLLSYWQTCCDENIQVIDDFDALKSSIENIILINYSAFNSNEKEMIHLLSNQSNIIFVLDRNPNIKTAREVLSYGAKGYGNALMRKHFLLEAIETMKEGLIWLHPELTSQLIYQIRDNIGKDITPLIKDLSQREKEVVFLLRDGDTYKEVAKKLNITPRTVKAHAHNIYIKLHVKDRLSLSMLLK